MKDYAISEVGRRKREEALTAVPLPEPLPARREAPRPEPDGIPKTALTRREAGELADRMSRVAQGFDRPIRFEIEDGEEGYQVKIVDAENREVLKMLPPEGMQELASRIEAAIGVLLDSKG